MFDISVISLGIISPVTFSRNDTRVYMFEFLLILDFESRVFISFHMCGS